MKKILLLIAVVFAGVSYGQTQKGDWFVESDLGLSYTSNSVDGNQANSVFKVTPSLNYFVIDNLAVGLGLSYENVKPKGGDATNSFIIRPNATYFFKLGGEIAPFVRAGVGYATQSTSGNSVSGVAFNFAGGVAYFVNEAVAITGSVDYDQRNLKASGASSTTNIGKLGVGIGVALFF
ncbi:MAG: outer membrane beta-barrel protein [Capnocytophaga sp.]|nr:outer membrane beta-barrel protein [Capnocytophaga sp.]